MGNTDTSSVLPAAGHVAEAVMAPFTTYSRSAAGSLETQLPASWTVAPGMQAGVLLHAMAGLAGHEGPVEALAANGRGGAQRREETPVVVSRGCPGGMRSLNGRASDRQRDGPTKWQVRGPSHGTPRYAYW